jgi:hypothetical protein
VYSYDELLGALKRYKVSFGVCGFYALPFS